MSHLAFVWANLRRRPFHNFLGLACATLAFVVYGLALGIAESFRRAALLHHVPANQQFVLGAVAVSAIGLALIFFLTANAMAQMVRLRLYEFGVLKALGFSQRRIIALVMAEAAAPCLAGVLLGLLTAPVLFAALSALLPPLAQVPPPVYTFAMLGAAFAIAVLIPIVSSVPPALRIARLDAAAILTGSIQAPTPAVETEDGSPRKQVTKSSSNASRKRMADASNSLGLMRQAVVVTRIGLSTLPHRIKGSLLIVGGVGCVVFVLLSILSMGEGIRAPLLKSGDPVRVVLRTTSTPRLHDSQLPEGIARIAAAAPGVARAADGSPLAEALIHRFIGLIKRNNGEDGYTSIVGVGPQWREMTPTFHMLSGRLPRPGTHELIAGRLAHRKFSGLDAGVVRYRDAEWQIVGTFATEGWWDGYLVGDAATVKANARSPVDSAVLVRLTSPQAFEAFRNAVVRRLPSSIIVERETDYYAGFWRSVPKAAMYIAFLLSGLIALGVIAGVTQIMHSAMEERRKEIAILRILGFSGMAVAASAVFEGMLLASLGALTGAALVWLCFDGYVYNGAWNVFEVTVNLHLLFVATGWALTIALLGTLPLAFRTVRQREIEGLRNLREVEVVVVASPMASSFDTQGGLGVLLLQENLQAN